MTKANEEEEVRLVEAFRKRAEEDFSTIQREKSPGQVAFENFFKGHPYHESWSMSPNQKYWERAAQAVLEKHADNFVWTKKIKLSKEK